MSLTNDMLKNLEKQKVDTEGTVLEELEAPVVHKRSAWIKKGFFVVLLVLVVVLIYFIVHKSMMKNSTPAVRIIPAIEIVIPAKPIEKQVAPVVEPSTAVESKPEENAVVKVSAEETAEDKAKAAYQEAMVLVNQGQLGLADEKLQSVINVLPEYQPARLSLATILLQQQHYDQAIDLLKTGLSLNPNNLDFALLYARALISEGQYHDALELLLAIADRAGNNPDYINLLAVTYQQLGEVNMAIHLYEKLLATDPQNGRCLVALGTALEQEGRNNEAILIYQKALNNNDVPVGLQSFVYGKIASLKGLSS